MLDKSHLAASHSGLFDNQAFLWLTATTIIAKSLLEMVLAIFFSTGTWACKGLKINFFVFVLFCFFLTTGSLEGKWVHQSVHQESLDGVVNYAKTFTPNYSDRVLSV